jgi:hypothetical protein
VEIGKNSLSYSRQKNTKDFKFVVFHIGKPCIGLGRLDIFGMVDQRLGWITYHEQRLPDLS